ncbi:hypothetical protein H2201_001029 [Coniosporium apollinis]|uniref:DNA2/NAM7 helicase-like C-terminal domain-containing protein n=2 Tax=Coniosporium TaxID=2810619 RepID=A0ABQ9P2F1_9PEZI|nr:hypothetical protein H2199_003179 [Cladosporium sp. JES 115]KAJ9668784.1 hypothetical protein H2201_001029 [Coniosporium apollinis]
MDFSSIVCEGWEGMYGLAATRTPADVELLDVGSDQIRSQDLSCPLPDGKFRSTSVTVHGQQISTETVWDQDSDLPLFTVTGPRGRRAPRTAREKSLAVLYLANAHADAGEVYGSMTSKDAAKWLYVSYNLESQHPAIKIWITRTTGDTVALLLFAGNIRSDAGLGISMLTSNDDGFELPPVAGNDLETAMERGLLAATVVELKTAGDRPALVWNNITLQELGHLKEKYLFDDNNLSDPDKLIGALQTCSCVSVFSVLPKDAEELFNRLAQHVRATMALCMRYGYFWFYQLQSSGIEIHDPRFILDETIPPRWLTRKWRAKFNTGKCIELNHIEWESSRTLNRYPDSNTFAFLCRLAVTREKQVREAQLALMIDSDRANISGTFIAFPRNGDRYIVNLYAHHPEHKGEYDPIYPVPGTQVTIDASPATGRAWSSYHGFVIEDHFNSGADFVAVIAGPWIEGLVDGNRHKVTVQIRGDATSTRSQLRAIESIQAGQERTYGVDLPALVLRAPPTVTHAGWLADQFASLPEKLSRFSVSLAARNLDSSQNHAIMLATSSENGVIIIQGPPGTGKTIVDMCMADALVEAGEKILVCGPSGSSVNGAYERFKRLTTLHDLEYVRYTGTYNKYPSVETTIEAQINDVDVTDLIWEMIDELVTNRCAGVDERDTFAYKFHQIICAWSESTGPYQKRSRLYLQYQRNLKDPNRLGEKKINRQLLKEVALELAVGYLAIIKVVFVTCNTSAHDVLAASFRPTVIVVDESANATIGDLAMPLAAFKESVQLVVLSGDHKQLRPIVHSSNRNEGYSIMKKSLFQHLVEEGDERYDSSLLTTQYHPVSKIFYDGKLKNAPMTRDLDDIQRTIQEYFSCLKPAWNGRFRMALDMSVIFGSNVESTTYAKTTSKWNQAERDLIVNLTEGFLRYEPKGPKTRPVMSEDIAIVTPYTGQRRAIMEALQARSSVLPSLLRVKIASTTRMQGHEAPIVLLSLVSSDPKNPSNTGFITETHQLCVEMSRAQKFLFMVGNFAPWIQDGLNNAEWLMQRLQRKHFGALLMDLYKKKDLIALPDWELGFENHADRKPTASFYNKVKV